MDNDTLVIPKGFNGPPHSGNGGYTAGMLARHLGGPLRVRITSPIPLDTPLNVVRFDDRTELQVNGKLIMTAWPDAPCLPVHKPPALADARRAHERPITFGADGPSSCFVCGRNRHEGEGLRVWCGEVAGFEGAVEVWTPHENFADENGHVRSEIIWSALDCPGGYSLPEGSRRVLLGQMTTEILSCPPVGIPTILTARHIRSEGRKHFATTALYSGTGELLARADTLWIELKPEQAAQMFG